MKKFKFESYIDAIKHIREVAGLSLSEAKELSELANKETLRDYFAAKALPGILTQVQRLDTVDVANSSYEIADAMIKAREREIQ